MLSHDLNVKDFKLPVDGKSGTGGLWMTYVVPPVLLNQGYSPPCKFGYTIYVMLTNSCRGHRHRVYYLAEHLLRLCATIGLRNSRCSDEGVQKNYLQIE